MKQQDLEGNLKRASPRNAHQIEESCACKRGRASFFSRPKPQKIRRPQQ